MFTFITGSQNPVVGKAYVYEISSGSLTIFGENTKYEWYLFKKQKNGSWRDVTTTPKVGKSVSYTFHEPVLGNEFELWVFETKSGSVIGTAPVKKQIAKLDLIPSNSKTAQIDKVVLLNRGSKDVNKANYRDALVAKAFCTAMFDQEVEFQLWEDDASGGGHNAAINKNNRHTRTYRAKVNEKGIAEAKIPLSGDERILRQIANKYLMKGDKSEGKNHEYYITASYHGKIQKTSQVNVDVTNPDYKKEQPKQHTSPTHQSPSVPKPQKPKKTASQPQKAQPKQNTPKFPATKTSSAPSQADAQARITDAYFVNNSGQKLSKAVVGDWVRVCIHTSNMIGKHVQYVVWEYDTISNDEISRSGRLEVKGDVITTGGFTITEKMFEKGADVGDSTSQNYFIEVLPLDVSAYSKKFGVSSDGLIEVEKVKSAAVVNNSKQNKANGTCICKENQFYWGNKLTCKERIKVLQVCANLWGETNKVQKASELMSIMHVETATTFSPSADNGAGFSGLIQFSDASAKSVQTTRAKLKAMTFIDQMDYVEKYLSKKKDKLTTMTDLYLMVLKPNAVGQGNVAKYILFDESISVPDVPFDKDNLGKEPWVTKYGYAANPTYMAENGEFSNKRQFKTYSKGVKEKRGFAGGKTYVWEVTQILKEKHYDLGKSQIFNSVCENQPKTNTKAEGTRTPWMDVAIKIAKEMKGCTEDKDPMYSKAKSYLRYCNNSFEPTDGENGPWCAAFMNWTIGQVSYSHAKSAASLAPLDAVAGKKYKEIKKPIYGCIVVYKHKTKWKGHTGFLYGMTKSGNYILLGGNQDNTIRFDNYGEYTSSSKKKKLYGFYIPIDYEVKDVDYLTDADTYATSNEINIKYGIVAGKATGKTN